MYCVLYVSLNNKKVRETSTCFARDKKRITVGAWCFTCHEGKPTED